MSSLIVPTGRRGSVTFNRLNSRPLACEPSIRCPEYAHKKLFGLTTSSSLLLRTGRLNSLTHTLSEAEFCRGLIGAPICWTLTPVCPSAHSGVISLAVFPGGIGSCPVPCSVIGSGPFCGRGRWPDSAATLTRPGPPQGHIPAAESATRGARSAAALVSGLVSLQARECAGRSSLVSPR